MKSQWKVTSNIIGETKMYAVYRVRNINEVLHSGNMEFATNYMFNKDDALRIVERLNKGEKDGTIQA